MDIPSLIVGGLLVGVGWFLSGFIKGAGGHLWDRFQRKVDPPPSEPYYVDAIQPENWIGKPREIYEARSAEGYEIVTRANNQVADCIREGWEHLLIDGREVWWNRSKSGTPCAFLVRKGKDLAHG